MTQPQLRKLEYWRCAFDELDTVKWSPYQDCEKWEDDVDVMPYVFMVQFLIGWTMYVAERHLAGRSIRTREEEIRQGGEDGGGGGGGGGRGFGGRGGVGRLQRRGKGGQPLRLSQGLFRQGAARAGGRDDSGGEGGDVAMEMGHEAIGGGEGNL
ncbi:glycine-rich RNA-binding protein 2-like [Cryptomeria japonica]|uniref:glycine-rich RNA-binding protein 2-like n=1 Tax=Cryptomeria japonica TaxID=3369 RepID=UPI0027DA5E70|nr:glycine-rich RNA-binding protein 2-like [Cryptomeria japonica]